MCTERVQREPTGGEMESNAKAYVGPTLFGRDARGTATIELVLPRCVIQG